MTATVRVVFALLVCATVGAFFLAQRIKRSPSILVHYFVASPCSPHGGPAGPCDVNFRLSRTDDVTVRVMNANDDPVRILAAAQPVLRYRRVTLQWDGRTSTGRRAPKGLYRYRINLVGGGRSIVLPTPATLERPGSRG